MAQVFDHLLGLPTQAALALLASYGITGVQVVPTAAPPRKSPTEADALRTESGEAADSASTRVVAVRDDGRTLVVSRFLVGHARLRGEADASASPAMPE